VKASPLRTALYELADRHLSASLGDVLPADYDRLVDEHVALLADTVALVLAALDRELPVPTTQELWDDAIAAVHRDAPSWQQRRGYRPIHRLGREQLLRELPEPLLRAYLACYRPGELGSARRRLLAEVVADWIADVDRHLDLYAASDAADGELYQPAYRSPKALKLEEIMHDEGRPQAERLAAERQIELISGKRTRDTAAHERQIDGDIYEGSFSYMAAFRAGRTYRRECKEHGIRGCSECGGGRRRLRGAALDLRFCDLARLTDFSPDELREPPRRGKPTTRERSRLDALAAVVRLLAAEGATLEAIGERIGRSKQRVSELLKRPAANPDNPQRIGRGAGESAAPGPVYPPPPPERRRA
jgi:hypothetical protein